MTADDRVGRALATIGDDLRPEPDPYGRVLARHRGSVRRRTVAVSVALLVVALGVTATGVTWTGRDVPAAGGDRRAANVDAWARKLADGPTHGAVGAEPAYVAEVSAGMMRNWRAGRYDADRLSVGRVAVPFVDDVGPYRIALAVLVLTRPDGHGRPYAHAWLHGARGATAAELTADAEIGSGLDPYSQVSYGYAGDPRRVHVAVVPPQCRFATTTTPTDPVWAPEPTGSYIVRAGSGPEREWWRVDCGGDVRAELPSPARPPLTADVPGEDEVDDALPAAGGLDRASVRDLLHAAALPDPLVPLVGVPTLRWVGGDLGVPMEVAAGLTPPDRAAVAVGRLERGGRVALVLTGWSTGPPSWSTYRRLSLPADGSTLVLRLRPDSPAYLVVPPAGAASVRATHRGRPVGEAAVTDGAARLSVPVPFDRVEAVSAAGVVVGRGAPVPVGVNAGVVSRWWED